MGLESASWVNELNSANPTATDPVPQGDDHLRLIKAVLLATFPDSGKAFRFPKTSVSSASATLALADDNTTILSNTTAATRVYTSPTLGASNGGWEISIVKTDASANVARFVPSAGTINGAANIEVTKQFDSVRIIWDGAAWHAFRSIVTTDELVDLAVTTTKIADNAVTFAKMQNIATARFLGRITADTGAIEGMTGAEATSLLNLFTQHASAPLKGLVPGALTAEVNAGKFLKANGTWDLPSSPPTGLIVDEKTAGADGGGYSPGSWVIRTLTDVLRDEGSFIALSASKFTLDAGDYYCEWSTPGCNISEFKSRLFNVTANTTIAVGSSEFAGNNVTQTRSFGAAFFTVVAAQELAIQIRGSGTQGTFGLGRAAGFSVVERYTFVKLWAL